MTQVTSILGTDLVSNSRATLNGNFASILAGKVESPIVASVLGTGTASATTFLRGDLTWQAVTAVALTLIPQPPSPVVDTVNRTVTDNTTMWLGLVNVPFSIVVNKLTIRSGSATTPAKLNLSVYSEDGQTRYISLTTVTVNTSTLVSTAVSAVTLPAGNYWFAFNSNEGSVSVNVQCWSFGETTAFSTTSGILYDVTSEPVLQGTLTITANTPPATITPTAITKLAGAATPVFRLDN